MSSWHQILWNGHRCHQAGRCCPGVSATEGARCCDDQSYHLTGGFSAVVRAYRSVRRHLLRAMTARAAFIAATAWIAGCVVAAPAYGLTSSMPSPTVSSPATHSYDDGHTDQSSTGPSRVLDSVRGGHRPDRDRGDHAAQADHRGHTYRAVSRRRAGEADAHRYLLGVSVYSRWYSRSERHLIRR